MGTILMRAPAFTMLWALLLALVFLTGCGGGGGGNGSSGGDADPETIVFPLLTGGGHYALFEGTSEGGATTNLTPISNANGSVDLQYVVSPDKQWVAYLADAETDQLNELYVSKLDGSVLGQKISPTAINSTRTIDNIVWSPDSTQVAYVADQEITNTWELYVSTINGAIGVKVSADPQSGREGNTDVIRRYDTSSVSSERTSDVVQWAPDGSRLAYIADWDINQVFELYTTTPDGNTNVVKISNAGATNGIPWKNKRESFAWAPDSRIIAYRSDHNAGNLYKLYIADPAAAGAAVEIMFNSDSADEFAWSPDSSSIAFIERDGTSAIWLMSAVLQTDTLYFESIKKVSGTFVHAGIPNIGYFAWSPDGSRLAFSADQNVNERYELFTTDPDITFGETLVSGVTSYGGLPSAGKYREFSWSPDGNYIAYLSYQQYDNVRELFASKPDGSSNVKLSGPLTSSQNIWKFSWSPDSSHVAYIADQNNSGIDELFASPIAGARETTESDGGGPASNPRLNPDLPATGQVDRNYLQWSEDSQRVFYFADQDVANIIDFYSSTRDGSSNNIKISTQEALSFADDIYPQLNTYCSGCHNPAGSAPPWYADNASDTYDNMNTANYFAGNFIVEKIDGTLSHSGGTFNSIGLMFSRWISEGANNN